MVFETRMLRSAYIPCAHVYYLLFRLLIQSLSFITARIWWITNIFGCPFARNKILCGKNYFQCKMDKCSCKGNNLRHINLFLFATNNGLNLATLLKFLCQFCCLMLHRATSEPYIILHIYFFIFSH